MGAPRTQTVGGGNAINTADAFNNFLSSVIGGNIGPSSSDPRNMALAGINRITGNSFSLPGANTGVANAGAQTTAFRNAVNTQLAGTGADRGQFSDYFTGLNSNPGYTPQDFSYTPGRLADVNLDSPEFNALRDLQRRQTELDTANLRASFSQFGAGGRGTGAAHAVGDYLSMANPRNILAQGELARGIQQLDLTQQGINNQNRLGLIGAQQGQDQLGQAHDQLRTQTGLNLNAQSMQSIQQILQLLFGSLNNANQLGTPGAQTIQRPNAWQQLTGGINDVLSLGSAGRQLFAGV